VYSASTTRSNAKFSSVQQMFRMRYRNKNNSHSCERSITFFAPFHLSYASSIASSAVLPFSLSYFT
jgi:hypothetical protein